MLVKTGHRQPAPVFTINTGLKQEIVQRRPFCPAEGIVRPSPLFPADDVHCRGPMTGTRRNGPPPFYGAPGGRSRFRPFPRWRESRRAPPRIGFYDGFRRFPRWRESRWPRPGLALTTGSAYPREKELPVPTERLRRPSRTSSERRIPGFGRRRGYPPAEAGRSGGISFGRAMRRARYRPPASGNRLIF